VRHFLSAMAAIMAAGLCFVVAPPPNPGPFASADIVSATDLAYPTTSAAVGTVVLEVTVNEKGLVEGVLPIREIPSLTGAAVKTVRNWEFQPALLNGKPTRSRTVVAVTFNPDASLAHNVALPPLSAAQPSSPIVEPEPVKVAVATFPQYPISTVTTGTVVIRATVDSEGRVENTEMIRGVAPLAASCINAVKNEWKFEPAEFRGKPIPSSIALAFVLRLPQT
jgi:TonB family protein